MYRNCKTVFFISIFLFSLLVVPAWVASNSDSDTPICWNMNEEEPAGEKFSFLDKHLPCAGLTFGSFSHPQAVVKTLHPQVIYAFTFIQQIKKPPIL